MSAGLKAVILAGGYGSRLSEETHLRPKPMVQIGNMPILWHIMKIYSFHGITDFVICGGYKSEIIKEFFINYKFFTSDFTINTSDGTTTFHHKVDENWCVTIIDTGDGAMTGGRILAIKDYLDDQKPFLLTYGDGVGDIDISESIKFHKKHGKKATITITKPDPRFGTPVLEGDKVVKFSEKASDDVEKINAGFFVLDKSVIELIDGPKSVWEKEPLQKLSEMGELMAFNHSGFWKPMDTLRDKKVLNDLWEKGRAPWKAW